METPFGTIESYREQIGFYKTQIANRNLQASTRSKYNRALEAAEATILLLENGTYNDEDYNQRRSAYQAANPTATTRDLNLAKYSFGSDKRREELGQQTQKQNTINTLGLTNQQYAGLNQNAKNAIQKAQTQGILRKAGTALPTNNYYYTNIGGKTYAGTNEFLNKKGMTSYIEQRTKDANLIREKYPTREQLLTQYPKLRGKLKDNIYTADNALGFFPAEQNRRQAKQYITKRTADATTYNGATGKDFFPPQTQLATKINAINGVETLGWFGRANKAISNRIKNKTIAGRFILPQITQIGTDLSTIGEYQSTKGSSTTYKFKGLQPITLDNKKYGKKISILGGAIKGASGYVTEKPLNAAGDVAIGYALGGTTTYLKYGGNAIKGTSLAQITKRSAVKGAEKGLTIAGYGLAGLYGLNKNKQLTEATTATQKGEILGVTAAELTSFSVGAKLGTATTRTYLENKFSNKAINGLSRIKVAGKQASVDNAIFTEKQGVGSTTIDGTKYTAQFKSTAQGSQLAKNSLFNRQSLQNLNTVERLTGIKSKRGYVGTETYNYQISKGTKPLANGQGSLNLASINNKGTEFYARTGTTTIGKKTITTSEAGRIENYLKAGNMRIDLGRGGIRSGDVVSRRASAITSQTVNGIIQQPTNGAKYFNVNGELLQIGKTTKFGYEFSKGQYRGYEQPLPERRISLTEFYTKDQTIKVTKQGKTTRRFTLNTLRKLNLPSNEAIEINRLTPDNTRYQRYKKQAKPKTTQRLAELETVNVEITTASPRSTLNSPKIIEGIGKNIGRLAAQKYQFNTISAPISKYNYKQTQNNTQKQTAKINIAQAFKLDTTHGVKQTNLLSIKQSTALSQKQSTAQRQTQKLGTIQATKQISIGRFSNGFPGLPTPNIQLETPGFPPGFGFYLPKSGGRSRRSRSILTKQPTGYTPSAFAMAFNIKGTKPNAAALKTGLSIRPIITRTKNGKRKRTK